MALQKEELEARVVDEGPENSFSLSALEVVRLSLDYQHKPLDVIDKLRKAYLYVLAQNNYKVAKVAEQLKMSRPAVYSALRALKINIGDERIQRNRKIFKY